MKCSISHYMLGVTLAGVTAGWWRLHWDRELESLAEVGPKISLDDESLGRRYAFLRLLLAALAAQAVLLGFAMPLSELWLGDRDRNCASQPN
jgi:hypothetical protein